MTEATDRVTEGNDRIDELQRRPFPSYSKYRDSGVEWLGEIPAHWNPKPFKASLVRNDSGVWGEDFDDDGTIVLRSTDQTKRGRWRITEPARRRLSAREATYAKLLWGDLLVTKSSGSVHHIGKTSVVDEAIAALNCCYSNFMQRLRVSTEHVPRFFWYFMNCPPAREQLIFLSSTTTGLGNLNGSIIGAIRIPMAPAEEQRLIAEFLDRETAKIDALVAGKERLIELLQEKRIALITVAVTRGLDPNIPMKDSGVEWLGAIPTHWKLEPLKRLLSRSDYGISESLKVGGDIRVLTMAHIQDGEVVLPRDGSINEIDRSMMLESGDLLFNRTNSRELVGKVGIFRGDHDDCVTFASYLVRLTPRQHVEPEWLNYLLNSTGVLGMARSTALLSVNQANLNPTKHQQFIMPVPAPSEQRTIAGFLRAETAKIDSHIVKIRQAINYLHEFRTALISAAVTGKIDVREGAR